MTYTQPSIDTDLSTISGEGIAAMASKIQAAGQSQIAQDIARLKAVGEPIYYEIGNQLVREEAGCRKFEYRLQEDGTEEFLGELL